MKSIREAIKLLKFSMVGVLNTVIDFSVFVFLVRLVSVDALLANCIAYLVAVTNSYLLNSLWTFNDESKGELWLSSYFRFVAVNSIGLLISTLVIYFSRAYISAEYGKILSVVFTLSWNFLASKYYVFKGK